VCYRASSCCLRRHAGDFGFVEGCQSCSQSQMKPFPSAGAALLNEGRMYSLRACYINIVPLVLENEWHLGAGNVRSVRVRRV